MGFETRELGEENYTGIGHVVGTQFLPKKALPWLDSVNVLRVEGTGELLVDINMHNITRRTPPATQEAVAGAMQKLAGIRALLESPKADSMGEDIKILQVGPVPVNLSQGITLEESMIGFIRVKAGPNSKIRSVLNQAELPKDMQKAILQELQKQWQRIAGN